MPSARYVPEEILVHKIVVPVIDSSENEDVKTVNKKNVKEELNDNKNTEISINNNIQKHIPKNELLGFHHNKFKDMYYKSLL